MNWAAHAVGYQEVPNSAAVVRYDQRVLHPVPGSRRVAHQWLLVSRLLPQPAAQSFFKLLLHLWIGLRMARTRHQFAPAMPSQQAVDRAIVYLVPHPRFKRAPDFFRGCQFSPLRLPKERSQELPLFFQIQIPTSAASLADCLHRCSPLPVVARDQRMNGRFGDSTVAGNGLGFAPLYPRVLNYHSALAVPRSQEHTAELPAPSKI